MCQGLRELSRGANHVTWGDHQDEIGVVTPDTPESCHHPNLSLAKRQLKTRFELVLE